MDDLSTDELLLEFDSARIFFAEEEEEEEEASYVVSLKDITERKRAEEQIEILSRFPAENPNPVLRIAPDGAILYANDASEQLLAIWNAQIGQVVPDDYRMQIEEVAKSGQKKEIEVRCGQGVFSCILAPVVSIGYVNVYGRDITERKRTEEALLLEKENFRRSLDESPLGVRIVTADGDTLYANRAILDLYGYDSLEELQNTPLKDHYTPESYAEFQKRKQERQRGDFSTSEYEISIVRTNGEVRHLQVHRKEVLWNNAKQFLVMYQDVTDRKLGEQALRESEERFRGLFENVFEGVYRSTQGGNLLMANPALMRMLGYASEEELLSIEVGQLYINPDDRGRLTGILEEEGEVRNFELNLKRKDGQKIIVLENARAVRDGQGNLMYYEGTLTDITERKRAEEALWQSEEQYRSLVEAAPDVIYTISAEDGSLTSLNLAFERLTGWSRAEWLGKPFMGIVHPDDLSTAVETFQKASRGEAPPSYQLRILSKSGEYMVGEFTTTPLVKGGKVVGELGIARDVTERKRAEEALAESERKLKTLFEILPVGVSILNAQRKIVYMNPALERILDISKESLFEGDYRSRTYLRPDGTLMPAEEFASIRAIKEQRAVHNVDTGVVKEDGTVIWTSVSAVPLGSPDWDVLVVTSDITERKRAEEALREATQRLEAVIQASPLPIFAMDRERIVKIWNPAAERTLGWGAQEVIGRQYPAIPKEKMEETEGLFLRALESGLTEVETLQQRKDGSLIDVSISAAPLRDSRGNTNGVMAVITDISERKRVKDALRVSEDRFRSEFKENPVPAYIWQKAGDDFVLVDFNTAAEAIMHSNIDHLRGLKASVFYSDRLDIIEDLSRCYTEACTICREMLYTFPSTRETKFLSVSHVLISPNEIVLYAEDITERKLAEQQLKTSQDQLRALAAYLQNVREDERITIAREIHDELGQVLTALKMDLSILEKTIAEQGAGSYQREVSAEIKEMSSLVGSAIRTVRRLVKDLRPEMLDIVGLVAALRWQAEQFQQHTQIHCELSLPTERVTLDPNRSIALFRILQESLTNVARHSKATTVLVKLVVEPEAVVLEIRDNGQGISETAMTNARSFGILGMRERAISFGGNVEVRGIPGKGTVVMARIQRG
jgi:PAS domain S-box-containing protein